MSALYQRRDDWVDNTYAAGPNDGFEGYDESAARVQFLYEGDAFEGLFNLHKRDLNGTARLFRANIIKPGTNDLVDGFDKDKVSTDGVNFSDLETWGGSARLRWDLGDVQPVFDHRLRDRRVAQPRRHRRRLRRRVPARTPARA